MATRNIPPLGEEYSRNGSRGLGGRWKNLWGTAPEPPVEEGSIPFVERGMGPAATHEATNALAMAEKRLTITVIDGFRIEARGLLSGWRITSIDQSTGLQHVFYVQEGEIYHLSQWNDATQPVVGGRVKAIRDDEKCAVLQAASELDADRS